MTTALGSYATAALLKSRLGIGDVTDDTEIGRVCDQVNGYIESKTRRPVCPITSATYLLDGTGDDCFHFPRGIRTITALSVGYYTGATKVALASTDYFVRPAVHDRIPGFPGTSVHLSPFATLRVFPVGYDTISMTGTTGWDAIPDEITELALVAAARAWHSSQAGQVDIVGTDEMGRPLVSRFFSARDLDTLRTYSLDLPG